MRILPVLLLFSQAYLLQAQTFSWARQLGGTLTDVSNTVVTDAAGNVYTTGRFEGTMDADPGPGTNDMTSAGGNDIFICKLDAAGNFVWAKQFGGILYGDEGISMAVAPSGNIYVTGVFQGTVDFNPDEGEFLMTSHPPVAESPYCPLLPDVFMLKLDASGAFVWAGQVGGNGLDRARDIALGVDESVCVIGEYASEGNWPVDLDPTEGIYEVTALSGAAAFMVKLDSDGNFLWANQWYSNGIFAQGCGARDAMMHPMALSIDGSNDIYCTGDFGSTVDFDPGESVFSLGAKSNAAFVLKLNSNGEFQLVRCLTNSGSHAYGKDVVIGSNGNIISVGRFDGTIDFDPGPGTKNLKAPGGSGPYGIGPSNAYVWVLDSDGDYIWAGQMGGTTDDAATSVDVDGTGNMYVSGTFTGTADLDPGSGKKNFKSAGSADVFIAKLTSSGAYVWAGKIGGTSAENVNAITLDPSDAIIITGTFSETVDFDPSSLTYNMTSFGGVDAFISKLSQGGSLAPPAVAQGVPELEVNIYPNPAQEWTNVTFYSEMECPYQIFLVDMYGRIQQQEKGITYSGSNKVNIYLNGLTPGVYQVVLDLTDARVSKMLQLMH